MKTKNCVTISNGDVLSLDEIPILPAKELHAAAVKEKKEGKRIVSFFGFAVPTGVQLMLCLAHEKMKKLHLFSTIAEKSFPSLTPEVPEAQLFEREIFEQHGLIPEEHPYLNGVRHYDHSSFFQIKNPGVHEVSVGPVHAGVIEPGHFRFQCQGETVLNLEIVLGYQHRGVEKALIGGPNDRTIHYMETLAGDTTIGHATAYSHIIESLTHTIVPQKAYLWRAVALELERLANHTGDLGALANDVGFLPTASFCGRLRGDFLNLTAEICGNRFGRNFIRPGGIAMDCDEELADRLSAKLHEIYSDTIQAVELLWKTPSILTRFENTGVVSHKICQELGLVGVAARSSSAKRDARIDFPSGIYQSIPITLSQQISGDVYARAYVRYLEIQKSAAYIFKLLQNIPTGAHHASLTETLKPKSLAISLIEGWRGEICHTAITDEAGKWACYKIVDPSFHNWMGLSMAMKDEEISNFPLCNKSFNLSYCGHDL